MRCFSRVRSEALMARRGTRLTRLHCLRTLRNEATREPRRGRWETKIRALRYAVWSTVFAPFFARKVGIFFFLVARRTTRL